MDWDAIDVGYELRALHLTLTSEQVSRYALAAHMPAGRFLSDEEARQEGLPGQIVPGNMSLSLFARLVLEAFPGARLGRLNATFRGLVRPGRPLVLSGVVTERHHAKTAEVLECDLLMESRDGDRWVTGTATVHLPQA